MTTTPLFDLDLIEMRWASSWGEEDDGQVRAWNDDVAALIEEVRRLRRVSNSYYEEMVRRAPVAKAALDDLVSALKEALDLLDGMGDRPMFPKHRRLLASLVSEPQEEK